MTTATTDKPRPDAPQARLEWAMRRLNDLPTIPNTLLRIWQIVDDPDSSAADLERVITLDQALNAKIIRLVNSPYHGIPEKVTSCRRAITLLGFKTVKNLSVCVSVVTACIPARRSHSGLDLGGLWRHAIAVGFAAEAIARRRGDEAGEAFTAGVLHDIGKFALNLVMPDAYAAAVTRARAEGATIREAEMAETGVDHTIAGRELASRWGFPEPLVDAVARHHEDLAEVESALVATVAAANAIARQMRIGTSGDAAVVEPDAAVWDVARVAPDDRDAFRDELRSRIEGAAELLSLVA